MLVLPKAVNPLNTKIAGRLLSLFLLLGLFSQIAQALLIRELLVVFQGNEISIGAFYGGWLFWIAVGSWIAVWQSQRRFINRPLAWIQTLLTLLPLLLLIQIGAVRSVRFFLDVPVGQFIPLGSLLFSTCFLTLPVGIALGLLFPLACKRLESGNADPITNLYVVEAIGALVGALIFTFILVEVLQGWQTLGLLFILMGLSAWHLAKYPELLGTLWRPSLAFAVVITGFVLVVAPFVTPLLTTMEQFRFRSLHPTLQLLDVVETRYGHRAVGQLGEQRSVVEDGRITASFPDTQRIALEGAFFHSQVAQVPKKRRVLLFGGINSGLASELLKYSVERLDIVVQDQKAFEHIRPLLPPTFQKDLNDSRIFLHFGDGRGYVNRLNKKDRFDLVLVLVADPSSVSQNRYYTHQFYTQIQHNMHPDGVLCTRVSGASNYLGRDVKSYSGSVFRTLGGVFQHILVVPGDDHTFCAASMADVISGDAMELAKRYRKSPPSGKSLPDQAFLTLLQAERLAFLRNRLQEEEGELNSDQKPVTFYLNMVLWGKFTASGMGEFLQRMRQMGGWPYWLPLAVYVFLLWLAGVGNPHIKQSTKPYLRHTALLALMVLGFVSMAAQLIVLFGFQAKIGAIYGRIALLNGLFMSGLAIGAYLPGQWLKRTGHPIRYLVLTLLSVATFCYLLPSLFLQASHLQGELAETLYYTLSTMIGLLAGVGFPLAAALSQGADQDTLVAGGLAEAGDHLGGALGGLVTGALLVPILGMDGGSQLLTVMTLLAIPPLLLAGWLQRYQSNLSNLRFFKRRRFSAFGQPGLTRLIWFVLITVVILSGMVRATAPGPQLYFGQEVLESLSAANHFELRDKPVPLYLGSQVDGSRNRKKPIPATMVALSSIPVAAEIRGYAGPINLLIAVDQQGKLQRIKYISSDETPSYIHGMEAWLEGFSGLNPVTDRHSLEQLDGLSGATVTRKAVLETIHNTVMFGLLYAFDKPIPQQEEQTRWANPFGIGQMMASQLMTGKFMSITIMLCLLPVVYLRGRHHERLWYLLASVLIVGITFNLLLTEVDLLNISLGHFSSWLGNPAWWLLVLVVVPTTLFFGQLYCGFYCPFGALSELISRFGDRLGWRHPVDPGWDQGGRLWKFILLALLVSLIGITGDTFWISFNPMQQLFGWQLDDWLLLIAVVVLVASLFYFRYWCRYWCPLGAFFALSNKWGLLDHIAPRRVFNRCDLGVKHPFDIDCIRCHRCTGEVQQTEKRVVKSVDPKPLFGKPLFALFMLMTGGLIVIHLWVSWAAKHQDQGGWRRVDIEVVNEQIRSGRLAQQPAEWFRRLEK